MKKKIKKELAIGLTAAAIALTAGAAAAFSLNYAAVQGDYDISYTFVKVNAERLPDYFYRYSKDYPEYLTVTNGVKRLKNLKELGLYISEDSDLSFLAEFKDLEILRLYCSDAVDDEQKRFDIDSLPCIDSLKRLEICHCRDSLNGDSLGRYKNLEYLYISDCPEITDFTFAKNTPGLREVRFSDFFIYKENILPVKDLAPLGELPALETLYIHITNDSYTLKGVERSESLKTADIGLYGGDMNKGGCREKLEMLKDIGSLERVDIYAGDYEELTEETKPVLNEWLESMREKGVKAYVNNMRDVVDRVWDNDMIMEKRAPDYVKTYVSQKASNDYEKLIYDSGVTADDIKPLTRGEEKKMSEAEKLARSPLKIIEWYKAENAEITSLELIGERDGKIFLSFTGDVKLNFSDDRSERGKDDPEYLFSVTAKAGGVVTLPDGSNYNVYDNAYKYGIDGAEITSISYTDVKYIMRGK